MLTRSLALAALAVSVAACTPEDPSEGAAEPQSPLVRVNRSYRRAQEQAAVRDGLVTPPPPSTDPGALISVTMHSKVGVLLDELPAGQRDRVAAALLAKGPEFWTTRATNQVKLTTYRLVFRDFFYKENTKKQLPLPPKKDWHITLAGSPRRETNPQHDTVVIEYDFASTLLTDPASPAISEPRLGDIGGRWTEPFTLPVDPELVFQRTRYACMDEEDFPPNSVDSEEADSFYDDTCTVEKTLSPHGGCHQTEMPTSGCKQAVQDRIGRVDTYLDFRRLPWDANLAAQARSGSVTNTTGADLVPVEEDEFGVNRLIYRYIPADSCEMDEQCVGAPGWRWLLQFATTDRNAGTKALDIGAVDYYLQGPPGGTLNDQHHIFEFSACHQHYHFTHYGKFSYGNDEAFTNKRGFCLQSTDRLSNNETSPLHHIYGGCDYQGVEAGWVDQYKAGLPCQWIDVTDVNRRRGNVTRDLAFTSNPDGFLCEGTPVLDAQGNPTFEPTAFRTASGEVVDRPVCQYFTGWQDNNHEEYPVTLPAPGEGYVTKPCDRGQIGPLRNCGFAKKADRLACTPGATVTLRCTTKTTAQPQLVRVCESSAVLGTGTACTAQEAVTTGTIERDATVSFTCPGARGPGEPGGAYSLYTGAMFPDDPTSPVTCTPF